MKNNGYIINHEKKRIIITKAFSKRAADIFTDEYQTLTKLYKDLPGYKIQLRTATVPADKKKYKGLTLEAMGDYIKAQDNSDERLEAFEAIKQTYTPKGKKKPSYPKVKAWFLKNYSEYKKTA